MMVLVFRSAHALRTLPPPRDPALDRAVLVLLEAAADSGPLGWGTMLALLFAEVPTDLVVRLAATLVRDHRQATLLRVGIDQAVTRILGQLEQDAHFPDEGPPAIDPAMLLRRLEVMRRAAELNQIENRPGFEQKRSARLQDAISNRSRDLFRQSLQDRFEQLERTIRTGTGDSAAILAIEADARRLRSFALGATALDSGRDYHAMIDEAIAPFIGALDDRTAVTRLRMVELLCGSERAAQLATAPGLKPRNEP
ncbi:hypothetical protein NFI95_12400 [Acetobacteraceae bacterium KSS8]|uniref:Uncharacterized protein n=1 Tax=Endosaccharibacter trunci TaxID=2812733 RepID=A0ABT1W8M6_9PROT|nr:hypothetical protein [Acetobacteraceae bacterium KSS8]